MTHAFIGIFYAAPVSRRPDPPTMPDPDRREPLATRRHPSATAAGRLSDRMAGWPRWVRPTMAGAGALFLILLLVRQPLADRLWPETRAQVLREEAAIALAEGRLTAEDGSGARELYEAALAMDPDRNEAREGLARVALAALAQAEAANDAGDVDATTAALALARALSAPRAEVERVAAASHARQAGLAGREELHARAEAAYARGDLYGSANAALPLYQRILGFWPDDADALRGREDALGDLLQQARDALRRGHYAQAARAVAVARSHDAGHVDLPDTQARLGEERDALLARADRDRDAGQLERAEATYRDLLEADPDAVDAGEGLALVAAAHGRRAERAAADFRFADADAALAEAARIAPDSAAVLAAMRQVEGARQAHARLRPEGSRDQRREQVATLLAQFEAAERRGDLLTPPGESAYDRLRAARALAPDDPEVRAASERLLPAAVACFDRELRANRLARTRACLDARVALAETESALATARRRLAQRWLAVGAERLGAGEIGGARAAYDAARELDPGLPELSEFAERLRVAGSVAR